MIAKIKAIFHNFVSDILETCVSVYTCMCMSLEYLMCNSFPQASAGLDEGNEEVDKLYVLKIYVLIGIKDSCIRYKINKVAEDTKH